MRIFIGIALRLKARNLPSSQRDAVLNALAFRRRNATLDAVETFIGQRADEATLSAMGHAEAAGDGTLLKMILEFISAHWEDLFNLLLKLIGGMSMEVTGDKVETMSSPQGEEVSELGMAVRRELKRLLDIY